MTGTALVPVNEPATEEVQYGQAPVRCYLMYNEQGMITGLFGEYGEVDSDLAKWSIEVPAELFDASLSFTHKVKNGKLVEMSKAEKLARLMPTTLDLLDIRYIELSGSDVMWAPGRKVDPTVLAAWETYRQALRDLTKLGGPQEMLDGWPKRPDGTIAQQIADFKTRLGDK